MISGHHKRLSQSVFPPVLLMRHSMLRRVSDSPYGILWRRLNEQAITSSEQLASQLPIPGKLCDAPSYNNVAFYLVPPLVVEALHLPAEMLLLFRAGLREDAPLGVCVIEAAGFTVHHELLGTVECDVLVGAGIGVGVVGVVDERRNFRGADCEDGRKPLTEFSVHSIW